jgi:hypothetical protein
MPAELQTSIEHGRRVVLVDLPLNPTERRAPIRRGWDLEVPERADGPDGKPEGLVVTDSGHLIIDLDTKAPDANLCWYRAGVEDEEHA